MELNWYFVETVLSGSNLYFEDMQNEKKTMWAAQLFGARHATSPASARPKENGSCLDRLYLVVANVVKEGGWGKIPKYWVILSAAKIYRVGGKVATLTFTIRKSRRCSDIQSVNIITDIIWLNSNASCFHSPWVVDESSELWMLTTCANVKQLVVLMPQLIN